MTAAVDVNDYFRIRIERFQNRIFHQTALSPIHFGIVRSSKTRRLSLTETAYDAYSLKNMVLVFQSTETYPKDVAEL